MSSDEPAPQVICVEQKAENDACDDGASDDGACDDGGYAGPFGAPFSAIVKGLHARLRDEAARSAVPWTDEDYARQWAAHVNDESALREYASAMHTLASKHWVEDHNGRVHWVHATIREYFREGGAEKALAKDLRRVVHATHDASEAPALAAAVRVDGPLFDRAAPLLVADIGSCYNPFQHPDLRVLPLDIAPALPDVRRCDILTVTVGPTLGASVGAPDHSDDWAAVADMVAGRVVTLAAASFHVCVLSLVLSYMPSTTQRYRCVEQTRRLLQPHGLLLVITPDSSSSQRGERRMVEWKTAIESLGFRRFKYSKLTHIRCLAFRAVEPAHAVPVDPLQIYHTLLKTTHDAAKARRDASEGATP